MLQHYQNNSLGGWLLGTGNVLGAWALDKRLVFPAESVCVWIIKGRYTGLQSGPINGPSSSRHTGGSLIKTSPYNVSPATSLCFVQGLAHTHSCCWQLFKQPQNCRRVREFCKALSRQAQSQGRRVRWQGNRGREGQVSKSAGQSRACPWKETW